VGTAVHNIYKATKINPKQLVLNRWDFKLEALRGLATTYHFSNCIMTINRIDKFSEMDKMVAESLQAHPFLQSSMNIGNVLPK